MKQTIVTCLAVLLFITPMSAQFPNVTIRQIQEVHPDSLRILDSLGCVRWTLQASPHYLDTVVVTGICVVPPKELNYTSSGFNFLLADTGNQTKWGGIFVRPNFSTGSPDTMIALQWGMLNIRLGDIVRFVGTVEEFPPSECTSSTWITPLFAYPLQILGQALVPPPVPVRISDFYEGSFPFGRVRFANGERYEGMRVLIRNVIVSSYLSGTSCTFTFVDSLGNTMSDFDASKWYTCRSHRDPNSTFALPAIGTRIDSIVGYILASTGGEAPRGFRIAPVFSNSIVWTEVGEDAFSPQAFILHQNYPNPFNPTTNIEYRIANREFVSLKVFDVLGREVATLVDEVKQPGNYSITFDAPHLSSGIYVYQLSAGSQMQSRKMMLVR